MPKGFIEVNGKKYKEVEPEQPKPEDVETDEDETTDDIDDTSLDNAAEKAASKLVAQLGLGDLSALQKQVSRLVEINTPNDSKLKQILNGKDYIKDADTLTKEEKIVGFYHALVTKNDHACKALAEGVDADGGYLIPEEFAAEIVTELADLNIMRQLVRVVPMKRKTLSVPSTVSKPDVYWTAENAAKTTTTAHFGEKTLTVKKLAAIIYASDEMIEDATDFDMVQIIIDLFAEAVAMREEEGIIRGNGTTQIRGLETARTNSEIPTISAAGAQNYDSIINLETSLPAKYAKNAVFLANRKTIASLRKLKNTNGDYLWQQSIAAGQPATLDGKPLYEQDWLGDGVIYFGDFRRGYWLGDRKRMSVKVTNDSETAFTKDQTAIRVVHRVAGNVVQGTAMRVLTGF